MESSRMKTNKKICIFAIALLLGINSTYAIDFITGDDDNIEYNQSIYEDEIKINKNTIQNAQEAISAKRYNDAINYMNAYIAAKPKKYEAYSLRGDAYYALRRYNLAQEDYQMAVDLKSSEDKLMTSTKYVSAIILGADKYEQLQNVELGDLYAKLMYAQKALNNPQYLASYENAMKYNSHIYLPQPKKSDISKINCPQKYGKILNPQGIDSYIYGAISDIENKKFNDAMHKLQNVTSNYPQYYLGHYLYGVALAGLDSDDEAIPYFEKAIYLNPYDFESMASLGQIYYNKAETSFSAQDYKKSIDYFEQALKLNPDCYMYYFYIGLNELQRGDNALAVSIFDKALKLNENDYNSRYYQAIGKFLNGDYQGAINNSNALLRKNVSNYNSVLYLRALSYYKLNDIDKALADLNNIQNNIEDIYNTDIKVVSEKEKTLDSYIYYLKSQIENSQGQGAASDMDKATQNPIIAQLAKVQKAASPYESMLEKEDISLEEYNKINDFYKTSLIKMLDSGIVITEEDIDNQYDYIRTTFADLGLTFKYVNPYYKFTTLANYPYKKYSVKLAKENLLQVEKTQSITPEIRSYVPIEKTLTMRETTPSNELMIHGQDSSLAQMLAANEIALPKALMTAPEEQIKSEPEETKEQSPQASDFVPETPASEGVKSSNISSGEPFIFTDKNTLIDKENVKNVEGIIETEKSMDNEVDSSNSYKFVAKEIKETPEFTIKTEAIEPEKQTQNNTESKELENGAMIFSAKEQKDSVDIVTKQPEIDEHKINTEQETNSVDENNIQKPEVKIASKTINTKYADINPEEFGIKAQSIPEISQYDEIIELDKNIYEKELFDNDTKNLEYDFNKSLLEHQMKLEKAFTNDTTTAVKLEENEEEQVKQQSSTVETQAQTTSTPVVVVPELNKPITSAKPDLGQENQQKQTDAELAQASVDDILKQPAILDDLQEENQNEITNILNSDTLSKDEKNVKKAQKEVLKQKLQEQKQLQKSFEAAKKQQEYEKKQQQKAQEKSENQAKKEKILEEKQLLKEQQSALKQEQKAAKEQAKQEQIAKKESEKLEKYNAKVDEIAAKQKAKAEAKQLKQAQIQEKIEQRNKLKEQKNEEKALLKSQRIAYKEEQKLKRQEQLAQQKLIKEQKREEIKAQKEQIKLKKAQDKAAKLKETTEKEVSDKQKSEKKYDLKKFFNKKNK